MSIDPQTPVRLTVEAAKLGIRITTLPLRVVLGLLHHDRKEEAQVAPEPTRAAPARPAPTVTVRPPIPEPVELEPEPPAHIDNEPELVGEFAEEGAGEGAGAELHVDEPWAGYKKMKVADIKERVAIASPEEAAVVQLYEMTHRSRQSILDAVERRTKQLANSPNGR